MIVSLLSIPRPTISTSSLILTVPHSILPVTTVPLPLIENTSSTGIRKSFSVSLIGCGIYESREARRS